MMRGTFALLVALFAVLALSAGTAAAPAPKRFVPRIDNPWFPLLPGSTFVYRGAKDGRTARDVLTVTRSTKLIQGARCTVLEDRLYLGGRLAERTTDWYAQDSAGTVWYFGEQTVELDAQGRVTSTEGTWQAGIHGASAGVYMPAEPRLGQTFSQEHYPGHAEDRFRVLSLNAIVSTPATGSKRALLTKEWTPLEPGVVDHKLYVRGVGMVKEQTVKGGTERLTLVSVTRR